MAANRVANPFFNVTDAKGNPITGGKVYIGVAGSDPEIVTQQVYWDLAGTIPASQPLVCKGGYIVNGSTPTPPYIAGTTYSIRTYDTLGNVVYYQSSVNVDSLRTDLAATTGAALIGTPKGTVQVRIDALAGVPGVHGITGQSNALGIYATGSNPAYAANKSWNPNTSAWGSSDWTQAPWSLSQPDGNSSCNNYLIGVMAYCYEKSRQPQYSVMDAWSGTSIAKWIKQDKFTGGGTTQTFSLTVPLDASAGSNNVTISSVTVAGTATTAYTTTLGIYNYVDGTITFTVAPANGAAILVNYTAPRWYAFRTKAIAALASSELSALGKSALDSLTWAQCEEDFTRTSSWYLDKLQRLHAQFTAESWITNNTRMFMTGPSGLHERYEAVKVIRNFCGASTQPINFWRYINTDGEQTLYDSTGSGDYTHFLGQSAFDIGYQRIGPAIFSAATFGEYAPYAPFWGRGGGDITPTDATYIMKASSLVSWDSRTDGPAVRDSFTGNGTTKAYTLTNFGTPTTVFVSGVQYTSVATSASFTASMASTTTLTVSAVASGTLAVGQAIYNASNTFVGTIASLGTGTGGAGTYILDTSSTQASQAMISATSSASQYYIIPASGVYTAVLGFGSAPANGAAIYVYYAPAINAPAAIGALMWGYRNAALGNYTQTVGFSNTTTNLCNYTFVSGRDNSANDSAGYSICGGYQNALQNTYQSVAGRGHTLADTGSSAVGTFSAYTTTQTDPVVWQVGVGSSTGARSNAQTVRKSGIMEQKPVTVSQLGAAGTFGRWAFVTDATVAFTTANYGTTVAGGSSNKVRVYDNGTNWVIG